MTFCNFYRGRSGVAMRCAEMRAAKARKRMEEGSAPDVAEVGIVSFSGTMFGCGHSIRMLHRANSPTLMLECDGQFLRPRSVRGVRSLLARLIWRRGTP